MKLIDYRKVMTYLLFNNNPKLESKLPVILKNFSKFAVSVRLGDKKSDRYKLNVYLTQHKHQPRIKVIYRNINVCSVWYDSGVKYVGDFESLPKKLQSYLVCFLTYCWNEFIKRVNNSPETVYDLLIATMENFRKQGCKQIC